MNKKQRTAEEGVALCTEANELFGAIRDYLETLVANGYNANAADEFEDADFTGIPALEHLTAAKMNAAINALDALQTAFTSSGNITAIRAAEYGG